MSILKGNSVNSDIKDLEDEDTMSNEEYNKLYSFFDKGDWKYAPDKKHEDSPYSYFWDDYSAISKCYSAEEQADLHFYTLVEEDGMAWILDGIHFVNRIGYFISSVKIEIKNENIRYW